VLLSVRAAARQLKVDPRNLRREILAGNLPAVRFGPRLRIDDGALQRWLQGRLTPTSATGDVNVQKQA
jgi:excisionase family DNA binding protein